MGETKKEERSLKRVLSSLRSKLRDDAKQKSFVFSRREKQGGTLFRFANYRTSGESPLTSNLEQAN